jgi:hypothetical protein
MSAGAAINIEDNGTATFTLQALDADNIPAKVPAGMAAPAVSASDAAPGPSSFSIGSTVAMADGTGWTYPITVVQPPPQPLHQNVGFSADIPAGTFPNQTGDITVTAPQELDVVAGPAASFVAAVSEP